MKTLRLTLTCILLTFIAALPAMAGPRTFVSGLGNDANPGTREQPKRTFASALSVTDPGGEIVALDSAGFASTALTINKSVSIIAPPGVYAGVRVASGNGIAVNAGASDKVILRGLSINGTGTYGINFSSGAALHVESCVINGFYSGGGGTGGIYSNSTGKLFVNDTIIRGGDSGIIVNQGQVSLDQVRMEDNIVGLNAYAGKTSARNSVASGNGYGFVAQGGGSTEVNIENCLAANNISAGVFIDLGTVRVSNCTVTDNARGLVNQFGLLESRGNNTVRGNTSGNTSGTITVIPGI